MTRKKILDKRVTVLVTTSFNGLRKGDTALVAYDGTVQGWERAGLVRVTAEVEVSSSAPSKARPSRTVQDDQGGVKG